LFTGAYLYFNPAKQSSIATIQPKQNDIAPPSGNKAVLTLADGTKIELDSSGNGTIALQGNVRITKQSNGEISYAGSAANEVSYNTLNVPRGSTPLGLTLSDGSQVWLNVGSSLTYPTAFTGKERKVKITGEAYFEVAHNASMPFIVQHDDVTVSVLGTHFNVNTYEDETAERITLLEGSVRVSKNKMSQILNPGQQASIANESAIKVLDDVNMDEVMAWKNGKFRFGENTDIGTIMRQISRWYNVDIEYEGRVNQRFWGSISKDVNVSKVLKILEATGGVKFKVEGNKIIVMPGTS
jgi:ferric-dicitrate binding protein FerR (iron transport regulator)